ncbi:tetratricopeptide repeat protein [Aliiglaciecola sp. LCG003]|uniref:YfgM family protein n=1 Tax=Aliiglaciecola sp. LCG003 TaxID=3053655 RepID=UPI0025732FC9|nr:tetratricopeptide repeat protein [Aliiglaciecola sp. LCG003]WJG10516.1 tetratricopeptide repeat protein [Aliiglaciecola sp. LCG003]
MEQFVTEDQQVEAIKRFWKENGLAIAAGVVLGIGGLYGWRWYNDTQLAEKESASKAYENVLLTLSADNTADAKAFVDSHTGGYSVLTALQLAKLAVDNKDLVEASKQLSFVADNASDAAIKSVANLRLARIQIDLKEYDKALATLALIAQESFVSQVAEIKGDVYVNQQKIEDARKAYNESLAADANNQLVKMKLDDLSVAANG